MLTRYSPRASAVRYIRCGNTRVFGVSHWRASTMSYLRDVRQTASFQKSKDFLHAVYGPAFGKPSQVSQPSACPTQPLVAVKVGIRDSLETNPFSRIAVINTSTGNQRLIGTKSRSHDSYPVWSPNGQQLAFLSDQLKTGVFGIFILDNAHLDDASSSPAAAPDLPGTPEALAWSPDGLRLLIRIAGHGADQAAVYGSDRLGSLNKEEEPSWLPTVKHAEQETGWRSLLMYDINSRQLHQVGKPGLNIWEAVWLGQSRVLAVVSDSPTEDAWYESSLAIIDIQASDHQYIYQPKQQLGLPTANPSGSTAAFVECLSSDRAGVAGQVVLIHLEDAQIKKPNLNDVDVTHLQWLNENDLYFMGLRGTKTVAGHYHVPTGSIEEHWASDQTCGPLFPEGAVTKDGECLFISESWNQAQQLTVSYRGQSRSVASWEHEGTRWVGSQLGPSQSVTWKSTDGLEIQGYLALPLSSQKQPYPLILNLHGGPVWSFRNSWCLSSPIIPLLVSQGYAVLSANPRGSTGQGPEFMNKIIGEMGGLDAQDLLLGVDSMVKSGIADQSRLGVMGVSYGGYMSAWLPTQSPCFGAAVPIAPVTNWYSNHNTSNIGRFDELFFQQDPRQPGNLYHSRSPVMFAGKYSTPVMQIVGAKDHCVAPSQAFEYDRALRDKGVESALVVYPEEGHGIRKYPAYVDFCARVLDWFETHLRK